MVGDIMFKMQRLNEAKDKIKVRLYVSKETAAIEEPGYYPYWIKFRIDLERQDGWRNGWDYIYYFSSIPDTTTYYKASVRPEINMWGYGVSFVKTVVFWTTYRRDTDTNWSNLEQHATTIYGSGGGIDGILRLPPTIQVWANFQIYEEGTHEPLNVSESGGGIKWQALRLKRYVDNSWQ